MAPALQTPIDNPPFWTFPFSKAELYAYLHDSIGVAPEALAALALVSNPSAPIPPALEGMGNHFLEAFALPENRLQFTTTTDISYAQLTNWVIRADLLRVLHPHFPNAAEARAAARYLADSGIVGVQDFARRGVPQGIDHNAMRPALEAAHQTAVQTPSAIIATTQTILVVKGAGGQTQDSTLSGFLKGFWTAVVTASPDATLTEQISAHPLPNAATPEPPSSGRIAEIHAGEQRLWVKESYWEPRIQATSPMSTLRAEWRMATYGLGHVLWELFSPPNRTTRRHDFLPYWAAFLCAYLLVFIPITLAWWTVILGQISMAITGLNATFGFALAPFLGVDPALLVWLGVLGIALCTSILPALDTALILQEATHDSEAKSAAPIERLPALASWLLIPLIGGFLLQPALYLLFLGVLVAMQGVLLGLRQLAWRYRRTPESDTRFTEWSQGEKGIEKTSVVGWLDRFILSPWLYRYIVVVALPIMVLLLFLAKCLRAIPGLAVIGRQLENLATSAVSGGLGDVVIYANEPGQAVWIRGPLMTDIHHFHSRTEVDSIHVFAHSQGTPISFETLFNHLPPLLRRKVKNYITIGSVLNYFNQVNGVLDLHFIPRFPRRPYPYTEFAKDFQWINFWNHTDPVTEFAALDIYEDYLTTPTFRRNPASPTNVRTRGTLLPWTSHSEYWTNVEQVQSLFAERLLWGTPIDATVTNGALRTGWVSHAFILRWWLPVALLLLVGFSLLIQIPTLAWLWTYNVPLWVISESIGAINFILRGSEGVRDTTSEGFGLLLMLAWAIATFGFLNWLSHALATAQRYLWRDS